MDNSNFVSLSLARSLEQSLDIVANNIANSNTAGFKAERSDFQDIVEKNLGDAGKDDVSFVYNSGSHLDTRAGALEKTGNPLDVAISGDGWFGYQTTTGQTAYGRDGRFVINAQGDLVTTKGDQVLDAGGAPIAIPANTGGAVSIAGDGTISDAQGNQVGKIGVFSVPGIAEYQRIGDGMMVDPTGAGAAAQPAENARLSQGFIEQSNVQPVLEMTRMIDIQRAYERAMKLLDDTNTLRQQTISQLGRTPA